MVSDHFFGLVDKNTSFCLLHEPKEDSPASDSPNHACWSPWTSMASPKSASFTAAFLHLLASSRFSGCRGRQTPHGRVRTVQQGAALLRFKDVNLQTVQQSKRKLKNGTGRSKKSFLRHATVKKMKTFEHKIWNWLYWLTGLSSNSKRRICFV